MDSLFWNSTLRLGSHDDSKIARDSIYSRGLVLLSVEGNQVGGDNLRILSKAIERNHWLVGINFAENNLSSSEIANVVKAILSHSSLFAARLDGNPGYSTKVESVICTSMAHSTVDRSSLSTDVNLLLSSWTDTSRASPLKTPVGVTQEDKLKRHARSSTESSRSSSRTYSYGNELESETHNVNRLDFLDGEFNLATPGAVESDELLGTSLRPPSRNSLRPPRAHLSEQGSPVHIPLALIEDVMHPALLGKNRPKTLVKKRSSSAPPTRSNTGSLATKHARGIAASVKNIDSRIRSAHYASIKPPIPQSLPTKAKKKVRSSEKAILRKLSSVIGAMSENLEVVSSQLKEVTGSLAKSVELQRSTQRELNGSLGSINRSLTYNTPRSWGGESGLQASSLGAMSSAARVEDDDEKVLAGFIRQSLRKKLESMLN